MISSVNICASSRLTWQYKQRLELVRQTTAIYALTLPGHWPLTWPWPIHLNCHTADQAASGQPRWALTTQSLTTDVRVASQSGDLDNDWYSLCPGLGKDTGYLCVWLVQSMDGNLGCTMVVLFCSVGNEWLREARWGEKGAAGIVWEKGAAGIVLWIGKGRVMRWSLTKYTHYREHDWHYLGGEMRNKNQWVGPLLHKGRKKESYGELECDP